MKRLLLIAVSVVVVTGAGVAASLHYQDYQNKKTHEAQVTAKAQADAVTAVKSADQKQYSELAGKYGALQAECQKGAVAYAQLTPASRAKTPAPNCTQ